MPFVQRGSRSIHYQVEGQGPTVVLVPGLGSGSRLFGTLPRRFAKDGFRCISFDPVGIKPSSTHQGEYDFAAAAQDIWCILDDLEGTSCILVGTSLGGKVALCAAQQAPDRLDKLVLLASSAVQTPRSRRIYRFFEVLAQNLEERQLAEATAPFLFGRSFHGSRPGVVDDIIRSMRYPQETRDLMIAQAQALQKFDGEEMARSVICPCLCGAGLEDTLTAVEEVRATSKLIAGSQLLELPKAGHSLLLEAASAYEGVIHFLRDDSSAG